MHVVLLFNCLQCRQAFLEQNPEVRWAMMCHVLCFYVFEVNSGCQADNPVCAIILSGI